MVSQVKTKEEQQVEVERVTIKFAGDSGDGMQLTGSLFSDESAFLGNDLATFPDYPAEIRAPAGSLAGVSGFQVQIGSIEIFSPGDQADVLVAMNPAAFVTNIKNIRKGATVIVNSDAWTADEFKKAELDQDPLEGDIATSYQIVRAPITSMTREALREIDLEGKNKDRCRNMFALGMVFWMFGRPLTQTEKYIRTKFAKKPVVVDANLIVLNAGYNFAHTIEVFSSVYTIPKARTEKGTYRQISGNQATALGIIAASIKAQRPVFLGSYPITPASDILHELSRHKEFDVRTVQAEDEIAGIGMAIGASYTGNLAFTTTSGPGLSLKSEALGLAVMSELPLVVVNVQRGGPSTGLPTKTEQSDLNQALYGRHGESPLPVIAASTPSNCFDHVFMAAKIAVEHMTPVILLTDGYLANGSEPWLIPDADKLPNINSPVVEPSDKPYQPYKRDEQTLVRKWCVPGTPGMTHRIGGLEKQDVTGNVNYEPDNHELMCHLRRNKIARIVDYIPEQALQGKQSGDLLAISWGGTYGAMWTAVRDLQAKGKAIALAHFHYINPLPKNTAEIFSGFKRHIVCELNMGQFHTYLTGKYPRVEFLKLSKIQGQPFKVSELKEHFLKLLEA